MNYFIHVTDKADQDLGESFDYIDLTLKNPLAADVLVDTAEKKLAQLPLFPNAIPLSVTHFWPALASGLCLCKATWPFIRSMKLHRPSISFGSFTAKAVGNPS